MLQYWKLLDKAQQDHAETQTRVEASEVKVREVRKEFTADLMAERKRVEEVRKECNVELMAERKKVEELEGLAEERVRIKA
jgi:hypothetical protein